jgi:hypothetical protein
MKAWKKAALEANGYRIVDIDEFLGLTPEELRMVEMRVLLARLVKRRREAGQMSQEDLAGRINSTQASISKIESAAPGVTLDLVFRSFFAVGGDVKDIAKAIAPGKIRKRAPSAKAPT